MVVLQRREYLRGVPVDILRSLVQSLVFIVILAMFLEMLLPMGEMRKYVKLVMGLMIIVAVVQAVGELTSWDYSNDMPSLIQREDQSQLTSIMESGKKISNEQQHRAIEQYRQGLANQIRALANINKDVHIADVDVKIQSQPGEPDYGQVKEITLAVDTRREHEGAGGVVAQVDVGPVVIKVGETSTTSAVGEQDVKVPGKVVTGLIETVANFYNLKPEQIHVIYR